MSIHKDAIYQPIFDFYETRILLGYYKFGDLLPAITKISSCFHVAIKTVRTALSLLEEKGYIQIAARTCAKVIYQVEHTKQIEHIALYFIPRIEGILDLYHVGKIFYEPLWNQAFCNSTENDWMALKKTLTNPDESILPAAIQFYISFYKLFDNALLLNLYWESIRYMRLPYLLDLQTYQVNTLLHNQEGSMTTENIVMQTKKDFEQLFSIQLQQLITFCQKTKAELNLEYLESIPFCWSIYRQRPQNCYSLASHIMYKIQIGDYPLESYLPSLPKMAGQLSVSERTLRRSLNLLRSLGVTQSFQGKGTLVCKEIQKIDFSCPEIKEGMRLYQESLYLLTLTIQQVTVYTLKNVPEEVRNSLKQEFIWMHQQQKSYLCFDRTFHFLIVQCPFLLVRECYGKLAELLTWGYPFTVYRLGLSQLQNAYTSIVQRSINDLQEKHWESFANNWKTLLEQELQYAKAMK